MIDTIVLLNTSNIISRDHAITEKLQAGINDLLHSAITLPPTDYPQTYQGPKSAAQPSIPDTQAAHPQKNRRPPSKSKNMPPKRHAASSTSATPSSPTTSTPKPLSSGPATLKTNASAAEIAQHVWQQYATTTPQRILLLDAFMAFLVLVGGLQFLYCVLAGNYVSCLYTYHAPLHQVNWHGFVSNG
jgi:hypothetical protein